MRYLSTLFLAVCMGGNVRDRRADLSHLLGHTPPT